MAIAWIIIGVVLIAIIALAISFIRFLSKHDYLEGVAAFMAKRPAVFSDR